ncbi:hypothetical protein A0H81_08744 [Grifola frondosa]|uniref:Uncharacterized protein n=1 Tax=Grifola frondosa TaxID=5627 RepID=A0A1C7M368_GRIFR|nr:hypothetical protein A0H81_08744 [Grifola frondosa]
MQATHSKAKYTQEEKEQALANLDLEVAHRTRQFEEWLADALENFRRHQESLILRMPRLVRDITMREFAKYNGNVQECIKGLKKEVLGGEDGIIDRTTRKRKWVESQEVDAGAGAVAGPSSREAESSRGVKNARLLVATPKKAGSSTGPGSLQKTRLPISQTPGRARTLQRIPSGDATPSRQKGSNKPFLFPRTPSRLASPSKIASPSKFPQAKPHHKPSASPLPRWPRKNENMLSVNGSPLANPYTLDLNAWFKGVVGGDTGDPEESDDGGTTTEHDPGVKGKHGHTKSRSIVVRSTSFTQPQGPHSRANSQTSMLGASRATHSRNNSQTNVNSIGCDTVASLNPPTKLSSMPSASALISVHTKDGHVLEFNPLQTSPEELDALEGISESAKRQAKEDMLKLIQAATERWKIS